MIGLMKTFERTQNAAYADYVARWAAIYSPKSGDELLGLKDRRPGYCGRWSPELPFSCFTRRATIRNICAWPD